MSGRRKYIEEFVCMKHGDLFDEVVEVARAALSAAGEPGNGGK